MMFLIGTDEAGYGPNLGPLVISASAWRVPDGLRPDELGRQLESVLSSERREQPHDERIVIADSKRLYRPGLGLAGLEQAVLPLLSLAGLAASSWREVWSRLAPDCQARMADEPWYRQFDAPIPTDLPRDQVAAGVAWLSSRLADAGVSIQAIRSRAVFPAQFNELVDRWGNKAAALSQLTLDLVVELCGICGDQPVQVRCDKHGGRNRYVAMLQHAFPDAWFDIIRESTEASIYRWRRGESQNEIRFTAHGESFLPTALASMVSKYLRELAMMAFNAFWTTQVPGLRPTAGYPVDARRFKNEIARAQSQLKIDDGLLWRKV